MLCPALGCLAVDREVSINPVSAHQVALGLDRTCLYPWGRVPFSNFSKALSIHLEVHLQGSIFPKEPFDNSHKRAWLVLSPITRASVWTLTFLVMLFFPLYQLLNLLTKYVAWSAWGWDTLGEMLATLWQPNCPLKLGLILGPALRKGCGVSTQPVVTIHEIFPKNQAEGHNLTEQENNQG